MKKEITLKIFKDSSISNYYGSVALVEIEEENEIPPHRLVKGFYLALKNWDGFDLKYVGDSYKELKISEIFEGESKVIHLSGEQIENWWSI